MIGAIKAGASGFVLTELFAELIASFDLTDQLKPNLGV